MLPARLRQCSAELFLISLAVNSVVFMFLTTSRTPHVMPFWSSRKLLSPNEPEQELPIIYIITPTNKRLTQKAELTRVSHTFMHIPRMHWIVVEDANSTSTTVGNILARSGIRHTHLYAYKTEQMKLKYETKKKKMAGKGFIQRNEALNWIRAKYVREPVPQSGGILYFADDDNSYDLRMFEQMREIKEIGVAPVAFVGGLALEKPVVRDGQVLGFDAQWGKKREYAVDMAGLAINLKFFLNRPSAWFPLDSPGGYFESKFVESFNITVENMELFGVDMNDFGNYEVLAWHTKTKIPSLSLEQTYYNRTQNYSSDNWEV